MTFVACFQLLVDVPSMLGSWASGISSEDSSGGKRWLGQIRKQQFLIALFGGGGGLGGSTDLDRAETVTDVWLVRYQT